MKKTLFLLLPLMTLALVGCNDTKGTKAKSWTTLENGQVLYVYCDTHETVFSTESYVEVKFYVDYKYSSYDGITMVKVETKKTNYHNEYEFVGSNVNYCLTTTTYN